MLKLTLKSYIQKGYLRKLTPEEMSSPSCWYMPHFPIVKLEKTTTKVRIVFDCSAKYEGVSLNDAIYAGPKLQTELFDVLVRFRRNPIGIACDIKQMYLQIEIEEKDRPYFRILWRDYESEREPDEYEFTRVVFGKNSAPMEAQYVTQENARRFQDRYPLAADTVLKSTWTIVSIASRMNPQLRLFTRNYKSYGRKLVWKPGNGSLIRSKLWKQSQKSIEHLNW